MALWLEEEAGEGGHTETIDFWVVGPTERFGAVNSKFNVFVSPECPMFIALARVLLGCPRQHPNEEHTSFLLYRPCTEDSSMRLEIAFTESILS